MDLPHTARGALLPLLCLAGVTATTVTTAAEEAGGPTTAPAAQTNQQPAQEPLVLELKDTEMYVNVMGREMPRIPEFPELEPKPGHVRGHVRDVHGKPLKNAKIGIRSSGVGGGYSGAQGVTDANGYYEFAVPWGACHFYNAGYAIDYGQGRAGLGLHPADGELDSFASDNGCVENFVLLPYGIGDRDNVQDQPSYAGNYYGGAIHVDYTVSEGRIFDQPTDLPPGSQLEITLTPHTPLLDGSTGRTIVVRKPVGTPFYVLNLPIATYQVSAKLGDGTTLTLREVGPYGNNAFGLDPKEAKGTAALEFRPDSAKAEMALPGHGNWSSVSIRLEK